MKHPYLAKLLFLLLFAGFGFPSGAFAQTGSVSGRVTDGKNQGIPGATVLIEGSSLGSSSNVDGTYNIQNVPAGPHTLIFSFVGYNSVRLPVTVVAGQNAEVSTDLAESATQLAEAVVVGYGTQRRQDVTGSIATVDSREFVKGQVTTPEQLIQGKVAGVAITTNGGAPGAGAQIRIRGGSSVTASNDPLIVIDGVPVDNNVVAGSPNALNLINPNDIETFTVLKDASATAIYGSRASNGVILITTKKGAIGDKFAVNFSSQFSVSQKTKTIDVLTGDQFRAAVAARDPALAAKLGTANTDWQDAIYRTAYTFDNNINFTGAVGKVPYRVSYGNLNQEGILKTSSLVRNSVAVGITPRLFNDKLRINLNLKGAITDSRFAKSDAIGAAVQFDPTRPVRVDTAGAPYGGYYEHVQSNGTPISIATANPLGILEQQRDRSTVKRSLGNIQLDYQLPFVPGLRANFNLGYDISRGDGTEFILPSSRNGYSATPASAGTNRSYGQNRSNWLNEFYLNYTRDFDAFGRLELLAGHSYQNFYRYAPRNPTYAANGTTIRTPPALPYPDGGEYALESYYGRLNYSLKNRYLLTATLRADRSSRFAPRYRTGYFPAVGLAWRLKEENFLKDVSFLSDLKLRGGYGRTGQQDIGETRYYGYLAVYTAGGLDARYQFGPDFYNTLRAGGYVADLKWEETATYNAGLDLSFLDGRLTATADVYLRKTEDLLFEGPVPAGSNLTNELTANVGSLENRGLEIALTGSIIRSENVDWTVNVNATHNDNKITSLSLINNPTSIGILTGGISGGGQSRRIQINSVGHPTNSFYVMKQVYGDDGKPLEGKYEDLNNDGKVDEKDLYRFKSPAPQVSLGLSSNLRYHQLNLAFTMRSYIGNYVYNNTKSQLGNYNNTYNTADGGFFSNANPDYLYTNFTANQFASDYYVEKASFLRMENVTLGYNLGKVGKGTVGLSLAVQNAFLITSYSGINPEIGTSTAPGIDNNFYPVPRTYTFGVNVGF
ncbi:SusC/RagA family TonB-linked outer membrane protein [Hymenobacter terrenus]|uniref:SusC/RagA family TonB-linked outer membrane protein n=1 Tax=Hymenobacter terrenus TaxID=1629124 RepID=UPI000619D4CC|nr:TonB-dependent receptor [Hymenobacter terrenus]